MRFNVTRFVSPDNSDMSVKNPRRLTPFEALIMDCVWDMEEATVRQVLERLDPVKPMAYNTVQTMMGILRRKGFLASRRDGRSDVYRPLVAREQMANRSLRELIDRFFAGSAAALVSQLLDSGNVGAEEIRAIRRDIARRANGQAKRKGGSQ